MVKLVRLLALAAIAGPAWMAAMGCGEPFSNKDLVYLKSLPNRELMRFSVPGTASQTSGLRAEGADAGAGPGTAAFYQSALQTAAGLNAAIDSVLRLVETIAGTPVTTRKDATFTWGPHSDPMKGTEWKLEITEQDDPIQFTATSSLTTVALAERFEFALSGRIAGSGADFVVPIRGVVSPADLPIEQRRGVGCIDLDFDAGRSIDPNSTDQGAIHLCYDTRGGQELLAARVVRPADASSRAGDGFAFGRVDATGAVSFRFDLHTDVGGKNDGTIEHLSILDRWEQSGRGRADLSISEGDVPAGFVALAIQCWDASFVETYEWSNVPTLIADAGDLATCATDLPSANFP
jgi:hypothetical protein